MGSSVDKIIIHENQECPKLLYLLNRDNIVMLSLCYISKIKVGDSQILFISLKSYRYSTEIVVNKSISEEQQYISEMYAITLP